MAEFDPACKSEKGITRTGLSVEDLGQRLADIWELSSEQRVKEAIAQLMLDVMRSGRWEPHGEPPSTDAGLTNQ